MLEKLAQVKQHYEEIGNQLTDPSVIGDGARYPALMKEYKELTPLVEKYEEYRRAKAAFEEAAALLQEGGLEPEFKEMVRQEFEEGKARCGSLAQELKILMLPRDENDGKNVIMEIRGGTGGEEAALFAHSLYRMYAMYAESQHWKIEVNSLSETELGGIKEISFTVIGDGAYSRLKFEGGIHRVQRVPETETQGRVHTSAATVAVMPEAEEVELELDPKELRIDTFRSSGAGGQHINKTSSAIRVTHLPTGMVVECQDERSQYKNKDKALRVLRSRLLQQQRDAQHAEISAERKSQVGSGDRSGRIRTYNFPQGRVTDHRIGLTLYKLDAVMDGALDELIDGLVTADQAEKLKSSATQEE